MSDQTNVPAFSMNPEEKNTLLFTQMVFQLSSLATMLMGKVPHPETGEVKRDMETAQLIIDQLEMLEVKTRGNLNQDEEQLLKQTLMSLRLAYVESVNQPAPAEADTQSAEKKEQTPADPSAPDTGAESTTEDSKKKFSKKY